MNLIELKFFKPYRTLKPRRPMLFYSNGPATWHSLPDIRHIKVNLYGRSIVGNHYYLIIWQQPWKFREILFSILKVRPFYM